MTSNETSMIIGINNSTNIMNSVRVRVRREGPHIWTKDKAKGMGDFMQGRGIRVG